MPEIFIAALANAASAARVAGTTHARKSMSSIYRASGIQARHPNQLDLFADVPINPASPGGYTDAPALPMGESDAEEHPPTPYDLQPLVEIQAADRSGER